MKISSYHSVKQDTVYVLEVCGVLINFTSFESSHTGHIRLYCRGEYVGVVRSEIGLEFIQAMRDAKARKAA